MTTTSRIFLSLLAIAGLSVSAFANKGPKIAVTDLAYTEAVSEYFAVAKIKSQSALTANAGGFAASSSGEAQYVAGTYSYLEQRELYGFTNDLKGALLKGTGFQLIQSRAFDSGQPQPTKAEQVYQQMQTGKISKPVKQPQVRDIVDRIRKGEFKGADYVLFGTMTSIQFRDELSPLQGTTSASYTYSLDLVADFSLINTKTLAITAAFSAQGAGAETKLLSNRGDVVRPNRGKVIRETSLSLASSAYDQLVDQLGLVNDNPLVKPESSTPKPAKPAASEEVIILK
ncbi:hypothetical protein [Chitinimonas sp. BJYL2]|uniref:hypothetical protein n=1 Tax=Chitinimonas sp. BJYL2 TaxID=2976696 RepID=UPI0022B37A67|nr:hypothetical protein [Chitinimonas sp. BJYL2]